MPERLRIAFVDHDLANFHADTFARLIRGPLAARGAELTACWANAGVSGRAWAAAQGVPWLDDPFRLGDVADAVMVLAPSNPETHLALCQLVLPLGLPTFVDKTFAPDLPTAQAIFRLADRHHAPIQSSSALRWTEVQRVAAGLGPLLAVETWGGGSSFAEYAIHPLELAVSVLGPEAQSVAREGTPQRSLLRLGFAGERSARVNVAVGDAPFAAHLVGEREERTVTVDGARLFADAMGGILDFLASGVPWVDRRETLAIRGILDAAQDPACRAGPVPLPGAAVAAR